MTDKSNHQQNVQSINSSLPPSGIVSPLWKGDLITSEKLKVINGEH
jgi:hypothetical protein